MQGLFCRGWGDGERLVSGRGTDQQWPGPAASRCRPRPPGCLPAGCSGRRWTSALAPDRAAPCLHQHGWRGGGRHAFVEEAARPPTLTPLPHAHPQHPPHPHPTRVDGGGWEVALVEQLVELPRPRHALHKDDHLVEVQRVQKVVQLAVLLVLQGGEARKKVSVCGGVCNLPRTGSLRRLGSCRLGGQGQGGTLHQEHGHECAQYASTWRHPMPPSRPASVLSAPPAPTHLVQHDVVLHQAVQGELGLIVHIDLHGLQEEREEGEEESTAQQGARARARRRGVNRGAHSRGGVAAAASRRQNQVGCGGRGGWPVVAQGRGAAAAT